MLFHTYERRRRLVRKVAFVLVIFFGIELSLQGSTYSITGIYQNSPDWLPDEWRQDRLLIVYIGALSICLIDLVVSGLIYSRLVSRNYARLFISLQLLIIAFLTSAFVIAEQVEARWPFTFVLAFGITMYLTLSTKWLKPLEPN